MPRNSSARTYAAALALALVAGCAISEPVDIDDLAHQRATGSGGSSVPCSSASGAAGSGVSGLAGSTGSPPPTGTAGTFGAAGNVGTTGAAGTGKVKIPS